MELALGFKPHTGWAVAVLVSGNATAPVVHERTRVTLCPATLPGAVYHHAQGLPRARAARTVADVEDAVDLTAGRVLDDLTARAGALGELVAVGIVGEPRDVPPLDTVLRSHQLLHLAEGELYRGALADAAADLGVLVTTAAPKGTVVHAASVLGIPADRLVATLGALRAELGAPWQADHKDATAAALVSLAACAWERSARDPGVSPSGARRRRGRTRAARPRAARSR